MSGKSSNRMMKSTRDEDLDRNLAASTDAFTKYKYKSINSPPQKIQVKLNRDACTFTNFTEKLTKEEKRYKNLTRQLEFDNIKLMEKERIISDLQEELRKLVVENESKAALLDKDLVKRKETELSTKKIATYCNDLKFKFENIVETMQMFENTINTLKKDHQETVKQYEEKIERKKHDRAIQMSNLDFLKKKIDGNRSQIRDLEVQMDNIKTKTEDQKNLFLEKEMLNKIKYDETEKKLSDYQKKIYEYQMGEEIRENETKKISGIIDSNKKERDELEKKIYEYQINNEVLKNQIKELNFKLSCGFSPMGSVNEISMDRNSIKKGNSLRNSGFY